ncbi:MAG: hypothetical protein RIS09_839, partial [Actinomycetota bacterium]
MKKKNLKALALAISLALVLTACDSDNRAITYKARVDRDYKVSGSISFIATLENTSYRNSITPIDSPIAIHSINYTFNAGTCTLNDFTVTLASSPATKTYYPTSIALAGLSFAGLQGKNYWLVSSLNQNWAGTTFNLGNVSTANIGIPCASPGAYTASSGTFARSITSSIYGAGRWTDVGKAMFASNIHPDDRGYLWAILASKDNFQNSEEPAEIKANLYNLFGNSVFNDYPESPRAKGEFATDLSSIPGVKAYKDADNRHVVEFTFKDVNPQDIDGVLWQDSTRIYPQGDLSFNRVCFIHGYGRFLEKENVAITNDPMTLSLSAAEISTDIRHQYGVDGIIVYGLGTVNAKSHTMYYRLKGWGNLIDYTGKGLLNPPGNQVCMIPGDTYKYKADSKSLTDAHKAKIKKNLARYKGDKDLTLSYLVDDALRTTMTISEFNDYKKFLLKRARAMK